VAEVVVHGAVWRGWELLSGTPSRLIDLGELPSRRSSGNKNRIVDSADELQRLWESVRP
jgi:hypothetical protein